MALVIAACLTLLLSFPTAATAAETEQSLSGTVVDDSGAPVAGATVTLYVYEPGSPSWDWASNAQTDADGHFLFSSAEDSSIVAGAYRLGFKSNTHLQVFYGGYSELEDSPMITLAEGQALAGLDAELDPSATVSGKVTDESGNPLAGIEAELYRWEDNGNGWGYWDRFNDVWTGTDGSYTVGGVGAGSYQVCFSDPSGMEGAGYVSECFPDQDFNSTLQGGETGAISLTALEQRNGVDAELELGGSISGTLTNESGEPLPVYSVEIWRWSEDSGTWDEVYFSGMSGDGEWAYYAVPAGTYRVKLAMPYWQEEWAQYADEYYPSAASLESASDIVVTAGQATTGINGVLGLDASISGAVTDASGSPLADAEVTGYAWAAADGGHWLPLPDRAYTDVNGEYTLGGLPAGAFRIGFRGPDGDGDEFYDDANAVDAAASINLTSGQVVTGIDASINATSNGEPPAIASLAAPQITGTAAVGQTLTATPGLWNPSDSTTVIQWQADGTDIPGATGPTLSLTNAYADKTIRVRVTASKAGRTASMAFSNSLGPVATSGTSPSCVTAQSALATAQTAVATAAAKLKKAKTLLKNAKKTGSKAKISKQKAKKKKAKTALDTAQQTRANAIAATTTSCT